MYVAKFATPCNEGLKVIRSEWKYDLNPVLFGTDTIQSICIIYPIDMTYTCETLISKYKWA